MRRCRIILPVLLMVIASVCALGQQGKPALEAQVEFRQLFPRSRSPIVFDIIVVWRKEKLLEGFLVIKSTESDGSTCELKSHPVSMLKGERAFRIMLPPVKMPEYRTELGYHILFQYENGERVRLDTVNLSVSPFSKWVFSLGLCVSPSFNDPLWAGLNESFGIENYDPKNTNFKDSPVGVYASRFTPADVGVQPLELCRYDAAVIHPRAFAALKKSQLETLTCWVRAGGSLCVVPGNGLKEYHVEFLNTIAGSDIFSLTRDGETFYGSEAANQPSVVRAVTGLGRSAVVPDQALFGPDWDDDAWKKTVLFLWKVREYQAENIMKKGKWIQTEPQPDPNYYGYNNYDQSAGSGFHPKALDSSELIGNFLLSRSMRVIPFGIVLLILTVFVIIIGPVEYYVLGLLNIRKYTWYVFPAVCVIFSLITVYLAERYMGSKDYFRTIRFVDSASGAEPCRLTAYVMGFTAVNRDIDEKIRGRLVSFPNYRVFQQRGYYGSYYDPGTSDNRNEFEGSIPGSYNLKFIYTKWSPRMIRYTMFPGYGDADDMPAGMPEVINVSTVEMALELRNTYSSAFSGPGNFYLLYRGDLKTLYRGDTGMRYIDSWLKNISSRGGEFSKEQNSRSTGIQPPGTASSWNGLFSVVTAISPHGGPDFTDLSMHDSSCGSECVLIYAVRDGEEITVYRNFIKEK